MSQSDFVSRGQALVAAGQFQEAVKVCRLGLLGRPTTVEGRVVLGQALLSLKRFDEVLAEMRVALELDHTSVQAQVLKAEALLRKGDVAPAIEELHKARQAAPGDPRIMQLLGEAENGAQLRPSVAHPAVGFVGGGDTKHYPGHPAGDHEDSGPDNYTIPNSLSSPGLARRSQRAAVELAEPEPAIAMLEVGDRSGTVEVDPELEGVEVEDDIDFDDLAAPPKAARPANIGGSRGAVVSSRAGDGEVGTAIGKKPATGARAPGPASAARNAVGMPSGPIGDVPSLPQRAPSRSVPPPRSKPMSAQPPIGGPARMPLGGPPAAPLPPAPRVAASLPAVAPPPQSPYGVPTAGANRPTMAIAPPIAPLQQDQLFGEPAPAPVWGNPAPMAPPGVDPRSVAAANEPTVRPAELDPHILALMSGQPAPNPAIALDAGPPPGAAPPSGQHWSGAEGSRGAGPKTGMRKSRSRLQVVLWMVVGIVVIGGGVFAGFKIRAMRLEKQIVAARQRATDLAKADTWKAWREARDSLANIAHASDTLANRAALARTRALVAFEFGDGLTEATADVEALAGTGGLDGNLAAAYLALAQHDVKAAKLAAAAAVAADADNAAAHYVAGRAALLAGDPTAAVTELKAAVAREARPLYTVGLALAHAAAYRWDDALAALDGVLAKAPDHPAAAIARAGVLVASGRATGALATEVRAQLDRVVTQGKRPLSEQQHGVSPAQVAFGYLALAQVDLVRRDAKAARGDLKIALAVDLDDARFAEEVIDTLYQLGDLPTARLAADKAMSAYPTSRRARLGLGRILIAQGRAADAIELLGKEADVIALPEALALRGEAYLAAGDTAHATTDFDAALKLAPGDEPALIGRTWLALEAGDVEAATKLVGERYSAKGSSPGLTTVYAATLRRSADPATRDKAKQLLEKLIETTSGSDLALAQLELARLHRDAGDFGNARVAFAAAVSAGNHEARFEYGLMLIEDRDPDGGRDMLDALLEHAGDNPPARLVIEDARARMLVGDHAGAAQLLERAAQLADVPRWQLDRERGRLALRKSDFAGAAIALNRALDTCGSDRETFLLAADVGVYEKTLAEKAKKLVAERLKGRPEVKIVDAKLALVAEKYTEAEQAYRAAKTALKAEKASPRRLAQADFGLGLIAYIGENSAEALQMFELVIAQDPSLVDAYVFAAAIAKDSRRAFGYAQKAVQYNPDYPGAWLLFGKTAHRLRDRKALAQAVDRLTKLAPTGEELKELRALR